MEKKIIIIGAGPTGLGAAYRLQELGYKNWEIFEANDHVGGLSSSFKDKKGFTWDIGGHVMFSHYNYFDKLIKILLGKNYFEHDRRAFIWLDSRFVPYPFQDNIMYLSKEKVLECILGIIEAEKKKNKSGNFKEWILATFGEGIAKNFMFPLNYKTWAIPLERMDKNWIAERIDIINSKKVLKNLIYHRQDVSFGPNKKFIFPKNGGTGCLFNKFTPFIKKNLKLKKELSGLDLKNKKIEFLDGEKIDYDILVSTIPLDLLTKATKIKNLYSQAKKLEHNSSLIVGLGLKQNCPSDKCWIYFPENKAPFYRVTYFSNYSPNNVPRKGFYSLMCETAYSHYKKVDKKKIIEETVQGLINVYLLKKKDRLDIVSKYLIDAKYAYPIPTLLRDEALRAIQPVLEKNQVFSRGRFGAWKYEVGNMDHSLMQGVEVVNKLLLGEPETIWYLP